MSGLLAILQQGASSLQAQQAYSSTVAHNLSNSNTAGFTRQRAEIAALSPAERFGTSFLGRGAVLQAVSQARDRFLEAQMPGAISRQVMSGTEAETLQSVSALNLDNSVAPALSNFFGQLRALSQNPGSANYREAAVSSARQLTLSFNRSAEALEGARTGIDAKIEGRLPEINEAARQLASLNNQIRTARGSGGEPNDLLDARLRLGDRLAELTGATPVANASGDLNLTFADGTALVNADKASQLSVLADPANGGHSQLYLQKPDGSPRAPLSASPGGELGGLLAARDGALKTAMTQLDQLAFDLSATINTAAQAGFGLDGGTNRPLFTGSATATGAARSLTLNAVIAADTSLFPAGATNAPGDNGALLNMIGTEAQALSTGTTATETLARITAQFGAAAQRAQSMHDGDSAMLSHLDGMRQATSGVSVDEELVNMQKAQRAYEAVSKVIKTTNDMLDTLMSLK